jgi:hypothetical protein
MLSLARHALSLVVTTTLAALAACGGSSEPAPAPATSSHTAGSTGGASPSTSAHGGGGAGGAASAGGSSATGGSSHGGASSGGAGGAATSAGGAATSSSSGGGGVGGAACGHFDAESDDTIDLAIDLGTMSDCDKVAKSRKGTLDHPGDHDWYKLVAKDDTLCFTALELWATSMGAEYPAMCAYFECVNGSQVKVTCDDTSTTATSPDGKPGCCSADASMMPAVDCAFSDDSVRIWLDVSDPLNQGCVDYSVNTFSAN